MKKVESSDFSLLNKLTDERIDLETKIRHLNSTLHKLEKNKSTLKISAKQHKLLEKQYKAMTSYYQILSERISDLCTEYGVCVPLRATKKPIPIKAFATEVPVEIKTLEGIMTASKGDYIVVGAKGEIYPIQKDIFKETYDILDN